MQPRGDVTVVRILRTIDRLARRPFVVLPLFALIAFLFTRPLYAHPLNLGHGDWLWFDFIWDASRKTYVDFHEIPWWNPYYCGGNMGIANGQGFAFSPLFLLLLPLPTALAMKVYLTTLTFVGLWGTYALARFMKGSGISAIVAACLFACSGTLGWHMNGQTGMATLHAMPWAMLFYLRGIAHPRFAILSGASLAFMLLTAGIYPAVITCLAIGLHAIVSISADFASKLNHNRLMVEASPVVVARRIVMSGAVAAVSMFAFSAAKILPFADYLRDHRRPIPADDAITLGLLWDALIVKRTTETQIWPHVGFIYAWWGEYGNYVGYAGVILCATAIAFALPRRSRELVLMLLALGIAWGDHGRFSPYALVRSLPGLGNLRVPTRYWIVVDLWLACVVAFGLRRFFVLLIEKTRGHLRNIALVSLLALCVFVMVDMVRTNGSAVFAAAMPTAPAPLNRGPGELHQVMGEAWGMWKYPPLNQGTLRCFDELVVDISPSLRPNLPHEIYLDDPSSGAVTITHFSPSRWEAHVELARDAVVVLNQNYFRGWSAEGGTLSPRRGLVAMQVSAGSHDVSLTYRPRGYLLGSALSIGMILTTIFVFWRARRQAA